MHPGGPRFIFAVTKGAKECCASTASLLVGFLIAVVGLKSHDNYTVLPAPKSRESVSVVAKSTRTFKNQFTDANADEHPVHTLSLVSKRPLPPSYEPRKLVTHPPRRIRDKYELNTEYA